MIRFCPACLVDRPCFCRAWRLEFFLVCDVHGVPLHHHCPKCRGLVRLEQIPLRAESVTICHNCGFDLRRAPVQPLASQAQARDVVVAATRLLRILEPELTLQGEKTTGAVLRPGMQVAAGGGNAGMSERRLHQVNGGAAVEGMGGVRVPEPVGRDGEFNAGAAGRLPDQTEHGKRPENTAMVLLAGAEDGIAGPGAGGPQSMDESPDGSWHLDGSGDAPFPENRDLAALAVRLQVAPTELTKFADADPGGI